MNSAPHSRLHAPRLTKRTFFGLLLCLWSVLGFAQPALRWEQTIGGSDYEELNALVRTADGGLVAGGSTKSNAEYGFPADASWNMLVAKMGPSGEVIWKRFFETNQDDRLWKMIATRDGGLLCGGYSYADAGGAKSENCRGDMDFWVVKLDSDGKKLWDKTFGGAERDELFDLLEMPDGGFLLCGQSKSDLTGDKTTPRRGDQDFWLVRTDLNGQKLWDATFGGDGREQLSDAEFAPDGNVLLLGATLSIGNSGDLSGDLARGGMDFWLVKIDPNTGQMLWNHRFGGDAEDVGYDLCVAKSGDLYLGGFSKSGKAVPTSSQNGKDAEYFGNGDFWLVKTDANGQKQRDWGFGGDGLDGLKFVLEDWQENLYLLGDTGSGIGGNKASDGRGGTDFWLISLDKNGDKRWEETIGGSGDDAPTELFPGPTGGFYLGGHSSSGIGFEKTRNTFGKNDFWVLNFCCGLNANLTKLGNNDPCAGEPVTLEIAATNCNGCTMLWSDGLTGPFREIPPGTSDTFRIFVFDQNGCFARDSMFAEAHKPPTIDLGAQDTTIFDHNYIVVGGNNPELQYKWNTGQTDATIVVEHGGTYAVTVTDPLGCTARDWKRVQVVKKQHVWAANVFSPNFDGTNDYFNVYADKAVRQVRTLQIADRWGTIIFRHDNYVPNYETDGWNGLNREGRSAPGVYTWVAELEFLDGEREWFAGTVLLMR